MSKRTFIELSIFTKLIEESGDTELLKRLQDEILKNPEQGDVIEGTGGLRKLRVAKASSGKSGGYRAIYLDLAGRSITYLITIYDKRVKDNLTNEQKKVMKTLTAKLKGE